MKNGNAGDPNGTIPEALKANPNTSAEMLQPLLRETWEQVQVPADWKGGHLVKLPRKGQLF